MNHIARLFRRILFFFKRNRFDNELAEEIQFHLEMKVQNNLESGMSPQEAHGDAMRRFGNVTRMQEKSREIWLVRNLEILGQDLRYAIRTLFKYKAFSAVVIITLALGIGANTAIFTAVNAALAHSMPYPQASRLVHLWETRTLKGTNGQHIDKMEASYPDFLDYQNQSKSFESMAGFANWGASFTLTGRGETERIEGSRVTTGFFSVLRVSPMLGRDFLPGEDSPNAAPVVMLSHGLWQRKFGSDPAIIGQTITLDGNAGTVIGVMPKTFQFAPTKISEMWTPLRPSRSQAGQRYMHWLEVIGRLKPDATFTQAQAELGVIGKGIESQFHDSHADSSLWMTPLQDEIVGDMKSLLLVLGGAVGLVLLIACVNVVNLLLSRSAVRQKEIAIRIAIGANRGRVVRQLLTESLVLSFTGGIAGFLLALWGLRLLISAIPAAQLSAMPYLRGLSDGVGIDPTILAFTVGVSFVIGLVFGVAPALQTTKINLQGPLSEAGRSSASFVRQKLRSILVVSEIALALILLIGAGLLIKSTTRLLNTNLGFNPDNVVTMKISMPRSRYKTETEWILLTRQLTDRINIIPGVKDTAMINFLPFGGEVADMLQIEGKPAPQPGDEKVGNERVISNNYFQMMSVPLINGRYFTDQDSKESAKVVMVNQALVNNVLPDEDPIGRRLVIEDSKYEIVGVVGDEKVGKLDAVSPSVLYLPYQQSASRDMSLLVRTVSDSNRRLSPDGIAAAIQKEVHVLDPDIPIFSVMSMERLMMETPEAFMRRYPAFLMGIFAAIAMLLAMVGIYGVISYTVSQQTNEIGVRMALGAQRSHIFKQVAGQGLLLTTFGVAIGVAGAFGLTRVLANLLFGVTATDPLIFVLVTAILATVALLACLLPAHKAMRIDPMIALRF